MSIEARYANNLLQEEAAKLLQNIYTTSIKKVETSKEEANKLLENIYTPSIKKVETQSFFKSEGRNIYAFSDIHADIRVLIILLRDLAGVIKKKTHFTQDVFDPDLDKMLTKDITNEDGDYDPTLNYEWIKDNKSYVVIIGDMLDGIRTNKGSISTPPEADHYGSISTPREADHYYPQIEIKILRFINALNTQAQKYGGRIFKLFGNHEIGNILGINYSSLINSYAFRTDVKHKNYYRNETRHNVFKKGNVGFNELIDGGCRVMLVIDNYIFIHGQLIDDITYDNISYYTETLNDIQHTNFDTVLQILNNPNNSILWNRLYGYDIEINKRSQYNKAFCDIVSKHFAKFITSKFTQLSGINDASKLKIVVGHCPQHYSQYYNQVNRTFTHIVSNDDIKEILSKNEDSDLPMTGQYEYKDKNTNRIFGITMECQNTDSHKVFRVDVGSSTAFDNTQEYDYIYTTPKHERMLLFTRTPQLLHILHNKEQIIRSKMKNTRIHQPRTQYESHIKTQNITALQLSNTDDLYKIKYLKYKQKYLALKYYN